MRILAGRDVNVYVCDKCFVVLVKEQQRELFAMYAEESIEDGIICDMCQVDRKWTKYQLGIKECKSQ